MNRFRKKPIEVEATNWDGTVKDASRIIDWVLSGGGTARYHDGAADCISVDTLDAVARVFPGDWMVRGIKGEFYPCKPDIFTVTYERIYHEAGAQHDPDDYHCIKRVHGEPYTYDLRCPICRPAVTE